VIFLADEQGLGKTFQTVSLPWLDLLLVYMWYSISLSRSGDKIPEKELFPDLHKHLPIDAPAGAKCPNAGEWPIPCACEPNSLTAKIPCSGRPSIVYCLVPRTIPVWAAEVEEVCMKGAPVQLRAVMGNTSKESGSGYTRVIEGTPRHENSYNTTCHPSRLSLGKSGTYDKIQLISAAYVIVTNHQGVENHVFNLLGQDSTLRGRRKIDFQCIGVDESHLANGEDSKFLQQCLYPYSCDDEQTQHFRKNGLDHRDNSPTSFIFISGTPWTDVKKVESYWRIVTRQMAARRAIWEHKGDTHSQQLLKSTQATHAKCTAFQFNLAKKKEEKKKGNGEKWDANDLRNYSAAFGLCMTGITIRRTQETRLDEPWPFNTPIIKLPPLKTVKVKAPYSQKQVDDCNWYLGDWQEHLAKTILSPKNSKDKQKIPYQAVNKAFSNGVETILAIGSLPSIVPQIKDGTFNAWKDRKGRLKLIKNRMTQGAGADRFEERGRKTRVVKYLDKTNLLRQRISRLCEHDPKIKEVINIVKAILKHDAEDTRLAIEQQARDPNFVGEPKDHLQILLIATQSILSATTIFDVLERLFPDLDIALLTGEEKGEKGTDITDGFQDKLDPQSDKARFLNQFRPRILITVARSISTGVHFSRSNHLLVFEPTGNPAADLQLVSRQHRLGQERPCTIYRLKGNKVLVEKLVRKKQELRQWILQAAFNADAEIEGEEETVIEIGDDEEDNDEQDADADEI
jgi:hypothetical protein